MIRNFYPVRRNLLLRFQDDSIDETLPLAMLLQVRCGCVRAMAQALEARASTIVCERESWARIC